MEGKSSEIIRNLCKRKNIKISDLAEKLNMSSQNLSNKLRRDNFPESELHDIAVALNCKYIQYFEDKDGKIYKIIRED